MTISLFETQEELQFKGLLPHFFPQYSMSVPALLSILLKLLCVRKVCSYAKRSTPRFEFAQLVSSYTIFIIQGIFNQIKPLILSLILVPCVLRHLFQKLLIIGTLEVFNLILHHLLLKDHQFANNIICPLNILIEWPIHLWLIW